MTHEPRLPAWTLKIAVASILVGVMFLSLNTLSSGANLTVPDSPGGTPTVEGIEMSVRTYAPPEAHPAEITWPEPLRFDRSEVIDARLENDGRVWLQIAVHTTDADPISHSHEMMIASINSTNHWTLSNTETTTHGWTIAWTNAEGIEGTAKMLAAEEDGVLIETISPSR